MMKPSMPEDATRRLPKLFGIARTYLEDRPSPRFDGRYAQFSAGAIMDAKAREEVEIAVQALDEALGGLINFMMTLRPTLRNEILQICGNHIEKARQAKERLEALLQE